MISTIAIAALAGALLVGQSADDSRSDRFGLHRDMGESPGAASGAITFARRDIRPMAGMPGLFTLPSLTRYNGDSISVGIVSPEQGLIILGTFKCAAGMFALTGLAKLSDGDEGRVAIGETEPPGNPKDAEMTPVKDATNPIWLGIATAVCGEPA